MNYYKLDHDGTIIKSDRDHQLKYMPGRGWVRTQILNEHPHTPILAKEALGIIKDIEKKGA